MTDSDSIHEAYAAKLVGLYEVMFAAYLSAAGDSAKEKKAEAKFAEALALARRVRDRALALL